MAIQLAEKYEKYVDEVLTTASKASLIAGAHFDFTGANVVRLYKIGTAPMQDYGRNSVKSGNWSHYGEITTLDATTEELALKMDRFFTFEIDKLDADETNRNLEAAGALNRQLREVVIPEVDSHIYRKITEGAGVKPDVVNLSASAAWDVYPEIVRGSEALDNADAPEDGRYILVTPYVLRMLKLDANVALNSDIGADLRKKGVVATLDGANVVKVPAGRMPEGFGFLYGHPCAVCAPTKLADYKIHQDPPGLSGSLVEGRINYDAFVLENKANALYYQTIAVQGAAE